MQWKSKRKFQKSKQPHINHLTKEGANTMPEIYTVEEAAKILKIHPEVFRKYTRSGKIKFFKVGHRIRIKQPDLMEFVNNQQREQAQK